MQQRQQQDRLRLLGRLGPPGPAELALAPKLRVSEHNKPVSGITIQIQRHFPGYDGSADDVHFEHIEQQEATAADKQQRLEEFHARVARRAAQVQKQACVSKSSSGDQRQASIRARLDALKAFNHKVSLSNNLRLRSTLPGADQVATGTTATANQAEPDAAAAVAAAAGEALPAEAVRAASTPSPPLSQPALAASQSGSSFATLTPESSAASAASHHSSQAGAIPAAAAEQPPATVPPQQAMAAAAPAAAKLLQEQQQQQADGAMSRRQSDAAAGGEPAAAHDATQDAAEQAAATAAIPELPTTPRSRARFNLMAYITVEASRQAAAGEQQQQQQGPQWSPRRDDPAGNYGWPDSRAAKAMSPMAKQQGSSGKLSMTGSAEGQAPLLDRASRARITAQMQASGTVLPALCACGHGTSPLEPRYPSRCAANCQLYNSRAAYERLLACVLKSSGLM